MTESRSETLTATAFLEELRTATSQSHTRLESLPISAVLMSKQLSTADYYCYLSLMRGIMAAVENEIFPLVATYFSDLEARYKSHLIDADLQQSNPTKIPPFTFNPRSAAFAMGIFYVVEGATLGGRYILKNICSTLQIDAAEARFFAGYGNETGSMWKKFLNQLSAYVTETGQAEEVIAGAKFAFDSIYTHFESACK